MSQQQKTRQCKYGCGTELYWDNAARQYMEVKLRRTHKGNCPKFNNSAPTTETKLPTNEQAKEIVKEYSQKFPNDEQYKKLEGGISTAIELATQAILLQRDTIRLAKGEEIEVLLAQKDEEIAGLKEALRQKTFETAKGNPV